jgi:hypothetical protein
MGRKLVVTFLYDGIIEWYLRVPMIKNNPENGFTPQDFYTQYLLKDEYTFREANIHRLEVVKHLEEIGKRRTNDKMNKTHEMLQQEDLTELYRYYNC